MAKKVSLDKKYRRFDELKVGTVSEVVDTYQDSAIYIYPYDEELEEIIKNLKKGERYTCPVRMFFITKNEDNLYRLTCLSKETLDNEGYPNMEK
jgi:hypothetical protein